MRGQNLVRKFEDLDHGQRLQVHEIFYTLQGEGPYSGRSAVFIRLSGCNLKCWFCDTRWDDDSDEVKTVDEIIHSAIVAASGRTRLAVVTGGEPCRQNLCQLIHKLDKLGWIVQVETAGTIWQDCLTLPNVRIVCSPKTPKINPLILNFAIAFKYVISHRDRTDKDGLPITCTQSRYGAPRVLAKPRPGSLVYLSPCDEEDATENGKNLDAVTNLALEHGHIAGVQLHKLVGLK